MQTAKSARGKRHNLILHVPIEERCRDAFIVVVVVVVVVMPSLLLLLTQRKDKSWPISVFDIVGPRNCISEHYKKEHLRNVEIRYAQLIVISRFPNNQLRK